MRKTKTAQQSSAPKDVDEYLARVPEPARTTLNRLRQAIRSAVPPQAEETISYGMPAFRHNGVLVWFGAFSDHCSLFPTASIIEEFRKDLEGFSTSKGTIHFSVDKPLPAALVKRIVKARVARNEARKSRGSCRGR